MAETSCAIITAPFGAISLRVHQDCLISVEFIYHSLIEQIDSHPLLLDLVKQLRHYFSGDELQLRAPMKLRGTEFQQKVWQLLQGIPAGEVRRYGELAKALGSSARAVGNACRANPIPLFVPCHRVISASGLGGFSGAVTGPALAAKKGLLTHEGVVLA